MPVESLKSFTASLLSQVPEDEASPRVIVVKPQMAAPTAVRPNGQKVQPAQPAYDPAFVCLLELATILATRDEETVAVIGKEVADHLQLAVRDSGRLHSVAVSRASYYLLTLLKASDVSFLADTCLCTPTDTLQDLDYIRTPVVLHAISSFSQNLLKECAQPVLKGLSECIKGPMSLQKEIASSPDFWAVLQSLQPLPAAAALVFGILEDVTAGSSQAITADNYESAISLLNAFASAGSVGAVRETRKDRGQRNRAPAEKKVPAMANEAVTRGVKSVAIVHGMTNRIAAFIEQSHLETNEAWQAYWFPIFRCFIMQCTNPCREIRQQAFASLQRCLLSNDLASPDHKEWTNIFSQVLFPLIHQLLKPEVYQTDPVGMSETRVHAAQLLCRIFLHYLVLLSEWEGMHDLWMEILDIMDRLMNSGQGDTLVSRFSSPPPYSRTNSKRWLTILLVQQEEAVPESLKNILLVMSSGGYLTPPTKGSEQSEQQRKLWNETWARLNRFLPDLMPELFPQEPEKPEVESVAEAEAEAEAPEAPAIEEVPEAQEPAAPAA